MRRPLTTRVIALLLAFLGSFSAPGAALAHGTAHQRERHGEHARHAQAHRGHDDHERAHAHDGHGAAAAGVQAGGPGVVVPFARQAVAENDEPEGSHDHPTLDLPVRPRVEVAAILPLIAVVTALASPATEVTTGTPVPHAALPRPDPDAAAPPRTRAPPLR